MNLLKQGCLALIVAASLGMLTAAGMIGNLNAAENVQCGQDILSEKNKSDAINRLISSSLFNGLRRRAGVVGFSFIEAEISRDKIDGKCLIVVPVYINEPSRLYMWKIFAIGDGGAVFYQNADGDYVSEPVRKVLESDESVVIPWLPR